MYSVDKELEEKLQEFNRRLGHKYRGIFQGEDQDFFDFINQHIGRIIGMEKMDQASLEALAQAGGVVAVDGSVNRKGGLDPHYVDVFRALAKSSLGGEDISLSEIYSPLLEDRQDQEEEEEPKSQRDRILARLEVEAALASLEKHRPALIMMDGSFIRFEINCRELWQQLRYQCEKDQVLLIGVIEDIKTSIIGRQLLEEGRLQGLVHDRELLYGRLAYGQALLIDDRVNDKARDGELSSAFLRTALSPNIIGLDIIDSQRQHIGRMCNLVYSLVPKNSRGIPLWLDIVDKEVKISQGLMEGMLENNLDRDLYERFFLEARSKRN